MELMNDELKEKLLKAGQELMDIEDLDISKCKVLAHYFSPLIGWDWYVISAVEEDGVMFMYAYVCGICDEWGEVTLRTLEEFGAELDLYPKDLTPYDYAHYNGHKDGLFC